MLVGYTVLLKPDAQTQQITAWMSITVEGNQTRAVIATVLGEPGVASLHDTTGRWDLLAALRAGVVRYRSEGKTFVLAVGAGFAEAGGDTMTILTDRCVDSKDVDLAKARADLDAAAKKLEAFSGPQEGAEFDELTRSAQWFQAQLEAARESGRG